MKPEDPNEQNGVTPSVGENLEIPFEKGLTNDEVEFIKCILTDEDRFRIITNEMIETFKVKNTAYGDSFKKSYVEFGLVSPLIRMSDKLNRLKELQKFIGDASLMEHVSNNESIEDTLLDLANYAVMTLLEVRKYE